MAPGLKRRRRTDPPLARRAVISPTPHILSAANSALRRPCGWIPTPRARPLVGFLSRNGNAGAGSAAGVRARYGRGCKLRRDALCTRLLGACLPPHRRVDICCERALRGPHLVWAGRHRSGREVLLGGWAVTGGTRKGTEVRRRHPTARASVPLSPVQRPNPGPLPAQARLARSSEPILIPKLRI